MSKCTLSAGHFDGHGIAPVKYEEHCPMQHVQGYTRRHWTPPLGNYLLSIAPAAARATSKQMKMKSAPNLLAVLMAMLMRRYVTLCIIRWRRSRASLEATGRHHCASIMSNNIKGTYRCRFLLMFFIVNTLKTGAKQTG
jgi:hypothetical protein